MPITVEVLESQRLVLTNLLTDQDLSCRVARVVLTRKGKTLAALEFLQPSEGFWGVYLLATSGEATTQTRP